MDTQALEELYRRVNNWGRWGSEDELGTLNFITPEVTVRAAREVRQGITVACGSLNVQGQQPNGSPGWGMLRTGADDTGGGFFVADWFGLSYHGPGSTHIDALSHAMHEGRMYNNRPAALVSEQGAAKNAITAMTQGIVTRGLLVDIPRLRGEAFSSADHPVTPEELDRALRSQGVTAQSGDALLLSLGREQKLATQGASSESLPGGGPMAGLHASCLAWLHEHDISLLVSDGGSDVIPSGLGHMRLPVHVGALAHMGLPLVDNARLADLAATCAELERWTFLFSVSPLMIAGGTGSPVRPLATF